VVHQRQQRDQQAIRVRGQPRQRLGAARAGAKQEGEGRCGELEVEEGRRVIRLCLKAGFGTVDGPVV